MPLEFEKPNASLLRELKAVARRATALDVVLSRANYLPESFPSGELRFWIEKLQALPGGTAEGCREPLLYAQERLSAVIRDHIDIDGEDGGASTDDMDAPPTLAREEPIGQAISDLIGTITVANSEYGRQADARYRNETCRDCRSQQPTVTLLCQPG